jgi:hypothetical protein
VLLSKIRTGANVMGAGPRPGFPLTKHGRCPVDDTLAWRHATKDLTLAQVR